MSNIFSSASRAQRAIPESGNGWPDVRLTQLGEQVKALYPELASWGPQLAGEAHLYYLAKAHRLDDDVTECNPGTVRSEAFMSFLLERLEHTAG